MDKQAKQGGPRKKEAGQDGERLGGGRQRALSEDKSLRIREASAKEGGRQSPAEVR